MKIYTKKGDSGFTTLYRGGKVTKFDLRIKALGELDELQAYLGLLRASLTDSPLDVATSNRIQNELLLIEKELYLLMAEVASERASPDDKNVVQPKISKDMIKHLEHLIDENLEYIGEIKDFIVPGSSKVSAIADVARTIARRAERALVELDDQMQHNLDATILAYINRLSDLLWSIARRLDTEIIISKDV